MSCNVLLMYIVQYIFDRILVNVESNFTRDSKGHQESGVVSKNATANS